VWALVRAGADRVEVWNRTAERARKLADQLGAAAVVEPSPAEIVVNCTSVGLHDPEDTFKALPLAADEMGAGRLVVDLVYRHGGTLLLNVAKANGAKVVDGLEILVAQGAASLERWTGRTAPDQAMREAVADIAR
jgi:shikimate dehydrogenase